MATRKVIDIEQNGEKVYVKNHAKVTYMTNGQTVEDAINDLISNGSGGTTTPSNEHYTVSSFTFLELELAVGSTNQTINFDDIDNVQSAFAANIPVYVKYSNDEQQYSMLPLTGMNDGDQWYLLLYCNSALYTIEVYGDDLLGHVSITNLCADCTITGVSVNGSVVATSGVANIPAASTSAYGVTKLSTSTSSTSTTLAATASAVRSAYNLANGKYSKPSGGIPVSDLDAVAQTAINNAVTRDTIGDLEVLQIQGFEGSISGTVYALPDDANGDEDDIILTKNKVKTINGQSIYGTGNISISGGSGSSSGSGNGAYPVVDGSEYEDVFSAPGTFMLYDMDPNKFYVFPECLSLDIHFNPMVDESITNEYLFQFTSGSEPTSLSLPDDIKWVGGNIPTISENKIYQISVLNNLAVCLEFDNSIIKMANMIYGEYGGYTINSQFPVASDVSITYWDYMDDDPYIVIIPKGESQVQLTVKFGYIESITPKNDDKYEYYY